MIIQKHTKRLFAMILVLVLLFSSTMVFSAQDTQKAVIEDKINSIVLEPISPNSYELDLYLDNLISNITTDDMTTYEKLTVSFEYIISNTTYGSHMAGLDYTINGVSCRSIYRNYGSVEGFGAVVLASGRGMCNAYSSAWILIAEKLGVKAKLVTGQTRSGRGGYTYHEWAEVMIDDVTYVVDPQLQQSLRKYWTDDYSVYFSTYAETGKRYIKY